MDIDKQNKIYCAVDEQRKNCDICQKNAIDSYYNKHLKSQTRIINFQIIQQHNIPFPNI